jgi:hypothetical protein
MGHFINGQFFRTTAKADLCQNESFFESIKRFLQHFDQESNKNQNQCNLTALAAGRS